LEILDTIPAPPDFGRVTQAAFLDSATLAVTDGMGCRVWIVSSTDTPRPLNGSCGGGPDELVRPSTLTVAGGLLRVIDGGTGTMVTYDRELREQRRTQLPAGVPAEFSYSANPWRGDSVALSVITVAGSEVPEESARARLAVILATDQGLGHRTVPARLPPIVDQVRGSAGWTAVSCAAPDGNTLAIANPWAFEVAVLPGAGSDASYQAWRMETDAARLLPGPPPNPASTVAASGIACADAGYLISQAISAAPERRDGQLTIRREARSYSGELRYREALPAAANAGLWLPVAANRDVFFVTSTDERFAGFLVRISGEDSNI